MPFESLKQNRAFVGQQPVLALHAAAVSRHAAISADNPVTGNDNANGIVMIG